MLVSHRFGGFVLVSGFGVYRTIGVGVDVDLWVWDVWMSGVDVLII